MSELVEKMKDKYRHEYNTSALMVLINCFLPAMASIVPEEVRERIYQTWRKIYKIKLSDDTTRMHRLESLTPMQKAIVRHDIMPGALDLDVETIRMVGRDMLQELEPHMRLLLNLPETPR